MSPSTILLSGAAGLFCLGLLMLYFAIRYRDDDWAFFLVMACLAFASGGAGCFDQAVKEARNERNPVPVVERPE